MKFIFSNFYKTIAENIFLFALFKSTLLLEPPFQRKLFFARSALMVGLLLSLSVLVGRAQHGPGPGYVLIGEDAKYYYYMKETQYENSGAKKLTLEFCKARLKVESDQMAITQMGFDLDSDRFETYASVSQEQKTELQHKAFDTLLDQGLQGTTMAFEKAKSLNPWNVNKAIKMLKKNGFGNEAIISALRQIAAQKDKPAMFEAYKNFLDITESAKQGWDTAGEMTEDPSNANLRLMAGALQCIQGNPDLGLIITTEQFSESMAYLVYLTGQVNDLNQITNDKLKSLSDLTARLKGHVDDLNNIKKEWQGITGHPTASPICK